MVDKKVVSTLGLADLEILSEVLASQVQEWERCLKKLGEGELSIGEFSDWESEADVEYALELLRGVQRKCEVWQKKAGCNDLQFLDRQNLFCKEQVVEIWQEGSLQLPVSSFQTQHDSAVRMLARPPVVE